MEHYFLNYKDNVCIGSSRAIRINNEIECREVTKKEYDEYQVKQNNKLKLLKEQQELLKWIEYYDKQVMQYNRCQRLGIEFDKDISELDNQANINQARLREINI